MKQRNPSGDKWQKMIMPLLFVFMAVVLLREGYAFGHWLFTKLH